MELTNDFRVALPVERAWAVLTDVERIAPCLPGAQLQEVEGDRYRGLVKVKVGPMTAQYKGEARFIELDEGEHVAVLKAEGKETRGQGTASATVTARLVPDGGGTAVTVLTDLSITGRVAQFGRGVLADVSAKLLDQFATSLEALIAAEEPEGAAVEPLVEPAPVAEPEAPATPAATEVEIPVVVEEPRPEPTPAPAIRRIDSPEPEPVDLIGTAGAPVAKRVTPVLAAIAVLWLLRKLVGRRRR